jgi:RNA-directed DNA polymerase
MDLKDAQEKTTVLQSKLYQAARENPRRRFYRLYDKLYREDVLLCAWKQVRANNGAPGIDGVSVTAVETSGITKYLTELGEELHKQEYKPQPVRRVQIAKSNGKIRNLGIPTVRDRIVQTATKLILEPIFEADFKATSYGFRPGIGQPEALAAVAKSAQDGFRFVVDADIEGFFDNLDHDRMMEALRRRISDGAILRLIYRWLKSGVHVGYGVEDTDKGTIQGGPISPMLANIYLHSLDESFGNPVKGFIGRIARFADDLVIQCGTRDHAERALKWLSSVLSDYGLQLNAIKTTIVNDSQEGFDFLGFHHRRIVVQNGAKKTPRSHYWPKTSACQKFRDRIKEMLRRSGMVQTPSDRHELFEDLNRYIRGWGGYFRLGQGMFILKKLDWYASERVGRYFARCQPKGKKRKRRHWQFFAEELRTQKSLIRLASNDGWTANPYRGKANIRWKAV